MTYLSADDILKADDRPVEDVDVPEWGGLVRVRGLSGSDRNAWEASSLERRGNEIVPTMDNTLAKLVARCIVDDQGERLFTDQQVYALGQKNSKALGRVAEVARRLSGIGEEAEEEALGNSEAAPSGSSTSSSPKKSSTSL